MDQGQPPMPPTPPAFERKTNERLNEGYRRHQELKSVVGANHLATMHEVGQLAGSIAAIDHRLSNIEKLLQVIVEQGRSTS